MNKKVKRVPISLDQEQLELLNSVKGLGTKNPEIIKNILLSYLSEKGYIEKFNERKRKPKK